MNYIFVMSLSGSCLYFMYRIVRICLSERLKESWYYLLLKIIALYFVLPLPWMKIFYQKLVSFIISAQEKEIGVYYGRDEWIFLQGSNGWVLNDTARVQMIFLSMWLAGVGLGVLGLLCCYFKRKKTLLKAYESVSDMMETQLTDKVREEQKIKSQVEFRICKKMDSAFTIGLWKPIIFYYDRRPEAEKALLLSHELIHIKRKDVFWQVVSILVLIMHWYNPLAWMFKREMEAVCESSCDEAVLQEQSEKVRADYTRLLIDCALEKREESVGICLSKNGRDMAKRTYKILNRTPKVSKNIGGLLIMILALLNSVTVLKYEEIHIQKYEMEINPKWKNADVGFTPEGEKLPMEYREYVEKYMDTYNVPPRTLAEDSEGLVGINLKGNCVHYYEKGRFSEHQRKKDGNCETYYYDAYQCTKCQTIKVQQVLMITRLSCSRE